MGYVGGDLGVLIPAIKDKNPEFDLAGCPSPVMKKGDAAIFNIILGKASMDTYVKAISDAKKAGYDELLKINQEAYNRYISVVKNKGLLHNVHEFNCFL